jgi:hypothetical protein
MRLTKIRGTDTDQCADGRTCPAVHETSRGTLMIIGHLVTRLDDRHTVIGTGGTCVDVPDTLLPELAAATQDSGGMLRIAGDLVTDPEALSQMAIGPGEAAIEISRSLIVPGLAGAHA